MIFIRFGLEARMEFNSLISACTSLQLFFQLLDLEAGELREAHVEDRLGLGAR